MAAWAELEASGGDAEFFDLRATSIAGLSRATEYGVGLGSELSPLGSREVARPFGVYPGKVEDLGAQIACDAGNGSLIEIQAA